VCLLCEFAFQGKYTLFFFLPKSQIYTKEFTLPQWGCGGWWAAGGAGGLVWKKPQVFQDAKPCATEAKADSS
jgi:hypothetical protein